jgi:hypothetical protein
MKRIIFSISIIVFNLTNIFSQDFEPPSNFDLYADEFDIIMMWEPPATSLEILEYKIYKNGEIIGSTTDTTFSYLGEAPYLLSFYTTAVYSEGESAPSNSKEIFVACCWADQYDEDFEIYITGEQLACQNPDDWTTWSGIPCSDEDAYISEEAAFEGIKSTVITDGNDLVFPFENFVASDGIIRFKMYIPFGYDAYFNVQEYIGYEWGMEVYFEEDGIATFEGDSYETFFFPYDTWFTNIITMYPAYNTCSYYCNGETIGNWSWDEGVLQEGGMNFYGWAGSSDQAEYYIDEFKMGNYLTCPPGYPTNLAGTVNNDIVNLEWTDPGGDCDLIGTNIYRNDELIDFTSQTTYIDQVPYPGLYQYIVTSVYEGGTQWGGDSSIYIEIEEISIFEDNFENYTIDEQLACQNPDSWTTWNFMPCSSEDPFVMDTFSFEGLQSILIQDSNNLVKPINNLVEGIYKISFQMFIPEGNEGVYNILQEFDEDSKKVGCRANFHSDGYLTFDNGTMSQPAPYPVNSWMKNEYYINLNEDWANFYLNDILYCEWSWSWGVTGQNNLNQLGGVNFTTSSWQINEACYFIDNFPIMEVDSVPCFYPPTNLDYTVSSDMVTITWDPPPCPDLMGYNIYKEGALIDFTNSPFYILPNEPGTYEYCIACVYESTESNCAWITIVITETGEVVYPGITVFPNPANEKFRIQSDEKISTIEVYNLSGQLKLQKKNLNLFQLDVNTSVLSTGSYIIKIETRGNIAYQRIILQ